MNRSRVVVRRLEVPDVAAALQIISGCRREYGLEGRVESILDPSDCALFETYSRRNSGYCVALVDGHIAGGAGIAPLPDEDDRTCELQRMYLRPERRGYGIGHALLAACIKLAQQFQFERCYAETISEMAAAIAFYERHGFRRLTGPVGRTGHIHNDCWMMLSIGGLYFPQEGWSM
jgi:putative acetyltransferase